MSSSVPADIIKLIKDSIPGLDDGDGPTFDRHSGLLLIAPLVSLYESIAEADFEALSAIERGPLRVAYTQMKTTITQWLNTSERDARITGRPTLHPQIVRRFRDGIVRLATALEPLRDASARPTSGLRPADEKLIELMEGVKTSVVALATSNGIPSVTDEVYVSVRKAVRNHPKLTNRVPEWLRKGASLDEAQSIVRDLAGQEGGMWQRRRRLVREDVDALIEALRSSAEGLEEMIEGERIGQGGFGEVYRWRHKLLGIDFAVKFLNPSFSSPKDRALERFYQEAKILFDLNHPNILRVHDVGELRGRPFIKAEYVDGLNLNGVLAEGGPLPAARARSILAALSSALAHAHAKRVIHRDLKPSNIMVARSDDRVVVLDFGLGVYIEDAISRITRTGEAAGGDVFTAPELLENPKLLDSLTDVYSLGALWYFLVVGRPPSGATVERSLDRSGIPPSDQGVILRCLGSPDERLTANDLFEEIATLD